MGTKRQDNRKQRRAPERAAAARKAKEPTAWLGLSLAASHVARIESLRPRYSRPWRKATRADVLRALVLRGLDAVEAQGTR